MVKNISNKLKEYYDNKFKNGSYSKNAVFLNPDPSHYHQKILNIIKDLSKNKKHLKILDIGCATGYLGAAIKKYGNHYVCGVEISEFAGKEAEKVLDNVIIRNIENIELPYPNDYFDVIICSDVLEHLFNPKDVLKKLRRYLNSDGIMIVVLPNVAHYSIRLTLLMGKWEYKNFGILDYGHVRFFTKKTAIEMFKDAGYKIEKIEPYIVLPFPLNIIDNRLGYIISKLFKELFSTLFAYTYMYILKKP
ncbi:class I SAM-dependent methyltransferase [Methanocaldococcus sp.]